MGRNVHKGLDQVAQALPFSPGGKLFVVAGSGVAGYNDIVQKFGRTVNGYYADLDTAINAGLANRGDTILVAPGHTETIASAGAITADVDGMNIIGLGEGGDRPTFTFSGTASTFAVSGDSVTIKNIVGVPSIDSVVSPFVISGASCELDIEWVDASATVEAVRAVLTTAAADDLKLKLRYIGDTGGNAVVNAVRLVGGTGARIDVDFYGVASTAVVEFHTTAVADCNVTGYMYNSGTTDFTKSVIDTVTGSTWFAAFEDGGAGSGVSGGSGNALAAGDLSAIASNVAAVLTDTGTTLPATLGTPNDTDLATDIANVQTGVNLVTNTQSFLVKSGSAAVMADNDTLFTTDGPILIHALWSVCSTGNDATASTVAYKITPTTGSEQTISGASASIANAAAGASIALAGTALATAALYNSNGPNLIANPGTVVCPAGTIDIDVAVGSTTGTWLHYMRYTPIDGGVSIT